MRIERFGPVVLAAGFTRPQNLFGHRIGTHCDHRDVRRSNVTLKRFQTAQAVQVGQVHIQLDQVRPFPNGPWQAISSARSNDQLLRLQAEPAHTRRFGHLIPEFTFAATAVGIRAR